MTKKIPIIMHTHTHQTVSYMILAPNEMKKEEGNDQKATKVCLEVIQLDTELYKIGHTKARS